MLADPERPSRDLQAHLAECSMCAGAIERARKTNQTLRAALELPVSEGLADRLLLAQTTRERFRFRRVGFALAATVVLSVTVGIAWQLGVRPVSEAQALERYVVDHIRHEPEALAATDRVPREAVEALLLEYGLELVGSMDDIVFLRRCPTPEGTGVHLVVRTDQGPVTVIYLPRQDLQQRMAVEGDGLAGYVERFRDGALALVGAPGQSLEAVSEQVHKAISVKRG